MAATGKGIQVMSMTLIEGHYEILGAAPDGDSVRFYPNKKEDWKVIRSGRPVQSNKRGGAQLRLDGIDALETHYAPTGGVLGTTHQPLDLGHAASEALLDWLGFKDVERGKNETVTQGEPKQIQGHVLAKFSDTYGRCVAFAFKGKHPKKTGDDVFLDGALLKQSLNYHLLQQGHAYSTYYSKLFYDLRREMTKAVNDAREHKRGIWKSDKTMVGFKVADDVDEVQEEAFVVPKLYRRMMDYFALNGGDTSLDGFKEYLGERDDRIFILSEGRITGFDVVVETEGQMVKLVKPIEDLVFQEK
jgi:endonuclease YncB( thermonuclease family)